MKLTIPENISLNWEMIKGIGKHELFQCLVVLIPALFLFIILARVISAPLAPLALICVYVVLLFATYLFFARLEQYQSIYLFVKRGIQHNREQQKFIYQRRKEVIVFEKTE